MMAAALILCDSSDEYNHGAGVFGLSCCSKVNAIIARWHGPICKLSVTPKSQPRKCFTARLVTQGVGGMLFDISYDVCVCSINMSLRSNKQCITVGGLQVYYCVGFSDLDLASQMLIRHSSHGIITMDPVDENLICHTWLGKYNCLINYQLK